MGLTMIEETIQETQKKFVRRFMSKVKGKKIVSVGYTADNFPYFLLDDGSMIFIQQDDEGNGGGVPVHEFTKAGTIKKSGVTVSTYLPEFHS